MSIAARLGTCNSQSTKFLSAMICRFERHVQFHCSSKGKKTSERFACTSVCRSWSFCVMLHRLHTYPSCGICSTSHLPDQQLCYGLLGGSSADAIQSGNPQSALRMSDMLGNAEPGCSMWPVPVCWLVKNGWMLGRLSQSCWLRADFGPMA